MAGLGLRRGRPPTLQEQENRAGLTFITPTLAIVVIAVLLPILWTIFIAFRELRLRDVRSVGIFGSTFTLENFVGVIGSRGFLDAMTTTFIYSTVGTILAIALGLAAALIVRRPFRGRTIVRASMLLPYVTPVVAVTFIWTIMLDPNLGIVNALGQDVLGWERPIPFLSQRATEVTILGLTFEVPVGVIGLLLVLRFIWTFNEFDDIYLLTGGGAGTEVVSVRIFEQLTGRGDIGSAAALSLVLAALLCVLLLIYFRRSSRAESMP